ncbi:pyrethroid hydrolase Ces2e-like isoform X2 [Macrotis lagotis]
MKFLRANISVTSISEDCLYLNIYAPDYAKEGARLPVMVWIHGGGLRFGSASIFDGSILSAYQNVIVVIIQYRLGILGFFSTGDMYASGNWGYLDQVAALRWVQENIVHFGGDPDCVTIFGESAGGTSVSSHIVSPMSKDLFHRAIMESGVAILPGLVSYSPEMTTNSIANLSVCEDSSSDSIVKCLRNKTEGEILALHKLLKINLGVIDGQFLPKHPEDLLASGKFNHVPSIIGVNSHEYGWVIPVLLSLSKFKEGMTRETIREILLNPMMGMPAEIVDKIMDKYLGNIEDLKELRNQFQEMMGDLVFVIPALKVAKYQQSPSSPVYFYEFQHQASIYKGLRPDFVKADHGDELRFVFGAPLLGGATEEEKLLSQKIMTYWANFARNGDPNGIELHYWPTYNQKEEYLQLDLQMSIGKGLKAEKMAFWLEILPQKKKEPDAQKES